MQSYYEAYQDEPSARIVMPQVFQTINIGLVQQYPQQSLSHSQCFTRPMLQLSHNSLNHHHHHHMIEPRNLSLSSSKELLVIDQSQEVQKRKAVSLEVAPMYVLLLELPLSFFYLPFYSGSEVPEFVFSPLDDLNGEASRVTTRASFQLPQSFYRNCYEMLRMKVPGPTYEGYRVYVHSKLGYSGNAKRFKQGNLLHFLYPSIVFILK